MLCGFVRHTVELWEYLGARNNAGPFAKKTLKNSFRHLSLHLEVGILSVGTLLPLVHDIVRTSDVTLGVEADIAIAVLNGPLDFIASATFCGSFVFAALAASA